MISEVLVKYLENNKRIVIPQFGAFIRKDGDGTVVFVEFLKKDDGVLMSQLQNLYGLSSSEAIAAIESYISDVRRQMSIMGEFLIDGLGVLRADANGVYDLVYGSNTDNVSSVEQQREKIIQPITQPIVQLTTHDRPTRLVEPISQKVAQPAMFTEPVLEQRRQPIQPVQSSQPIERSVYEQHSAQKRSMPHMPVNRAEDVSNGRSKDEVKGLRYSQPRGKTLASQSKKKTDLIMVIAIVAAVIAILTMIYGIFVNTAPELDLSPSAPQEQVETTQGAE